MFIPIILGTARQGRVSERAAEFVLKQAVSSGITSEIIDPRDYLSKAETWSEKTSDKIKSLGEKIKSSKGLIIVSPEYNHGYPGELKILLDNFYEEFFGKPVGICGVSASPMGGVRMVEQLRQIMIEFHTHLIREAVYFSVAHELFDEQGDIKDKAYFKRMETFFNELKANI